MAERTGGPQAAPIDTAVVRDQWRHLPVSEAPPHLPALCDEIDALRAERDALLAVVEAAEALGENWRQGLYLYPRREDRDALVAALAALRPATDPT